jgi:imidazoleglycerol-phosphate dehydratase
MRTATINRTTAETDIALTLDLDGRGNSDISSGVGFLDHMRTLFAKHGRFDLTLRCAGDTQVDDHHTTEDVGIALGQAFAAALGEKRGVAVTDSASADGRGAVPERRRSLRPRLPRLRPAHAGAAGGDLRHGAGAGVLLRLHPRRGLLAAPAAARGGEHSSHHRGGFKSAARSLRQAVAVEAQFRDEIPSTKGVL